MNKMNEPDSSPRSRKYIEITAKIAQDVSPVSNAKLAAIIVLNNQVVSIGTCQYKTHPFQAKYKPNKHADYWHAETNAIFNALRRIKPDDLSNATLYVARVRRDGSFGMSKPCSGCQHAIDHFHIKQVIYTDVGQILKMYN